MAEMSNKLVSIVIVTSGIKDYLYSLLESIKQQTHPCFEITAIDNSMNLDFYQGISKRYPTIKVYQSLKNLFYCGALNQGIKMSKGDFILCLNDDVILDKKFIEEALKAFTIDERISMVSGKFLRQDTVTIDSTGLFLSPWRTAKERGYGLKDKGQYEREEYIFGVNGAVAFCRRQMLEDIKEDGEYFDEGFRIFYEDLDLAWRAQRKGWQAYYVPKAIAYHIRGGTVRSKRGLNRPYACRYINEDLSFDLLKNRYLVLIKNESVLDFLLHLPFIFFYDLIVWTYILFFRRGLIKKFLLYLKYFKSAFRKRKRY